MAVKPDPQEGVLMSEHIWTNVISTVIGSAIGCWIALWAINRFGWFQ